MSHAILVTRAETLEVALARQRVGDANTAERLLATLVEHEPNDAEARYLLAHALRALGRFPEALAQARAAVALVPAHPEFRYGLGLAATACADYALATAALTEAVRLRPDFPEALEALGLRLLHDGKPQLAAAVLARAVALTPGRVSPAFFHAAAAIAAGQSAAAAATIDGLLAASPELSDIDRGHALHYRATARVELGDWPAAEEDFREAAALAPAEWRIRMNLAVLLVKTDRPEEALQVLAQTEAMGAAPEEVAFNRASACKNAGRQAEAIAAYDAVLAASPGNRAAASAMLLTATAADHLTADEVAARHFAQGRRFVLSPESSPGSEPQAEPPPRRARRPGERLRLAYVSADFRVHSVASFILPLLQGHAREEVELFCYSTAVRPDGLTHWLKGMAAERGWHWRDVRDLDDAALAAAMRADSLDMAIELGGHTVDNRLTAMALRPAPVVASYLGYANTTGVPGIAARFTDSLCDPPGAAVDARHSERLIRLPRCFLAYRAPGEAQGLVPTSDAANGAAAPAASSGRPITFGSFNNLTKVTPTTIDLWAAVLAAVPDSTLVIKSAPLRDPLVRERLAREFDARGIDPQRLDLRTYAAAREDHLGQYLGIDIALDTFPYTGTTTTCEALWMGVPVVTRVGETHASRVGLSLLDAVGLPELAAADNASYVAAATALAGDIDRRRRLRGELRARVAAGPLGQPEPLARAIEAACHECVDAR